MSDQELTNEDSAWQTEVSYAAIKVLSGVLQGKEFKLAKRESTIGRLSSSDIVLADERVSRTHAMIVKKDGKFLLRDLNSANGVYVNNLRLEKAVLRPGDIIQIGSCVLRFLCPQKWSYHKPQVQD